MFRNNNTRKILSDPALTRIPRSQAIPGGLDLLEPLRNPPHLPRKPRPPRPPPLRLQPPRHPRQQPHVPHDPVQTPPHRDEQHPRPIVLNPRPQPRHEALPNVHILARACEIIKLLFVMDTSYSWKL